MSIAGKHAVVTGAGAGIGRAIALRFAREGARVTLGDVNMEKAQDAVREIVEFGGTAQAVYCDVSSQSDCEALIEAGRAAYGPVDILVNNAGGAIVGGAFQPFHECTPEYMHALIDINLMGQLYCARAAVNEMIERRSGRIINLSSIRGLVGDCANIFYGTAKAGVIGFTKSLAGQLGKYGVTVNAIAPGAIASRPGPAAMPTYLGRPGDCAEVASLALFLAGDEAAFITGEVITIDGGRTCGAYGDAMRK